MVELPDRVIKGLIISGFAAGATATGGAIFAAEGVAVLVAYLNTSHGEQLVREIGKGEEAITSSTSRSSKKKRGPSAYNRKYKAEYAKQKKAHPRMKFAALAKRTHKALRRKK